MKKRAFISIVLVLALCVSLLAACAVRFDDATLENIIENVEREIIAVTSTPATYTLEDKKEDFDASGDPATVYIKWTIEGSNLIKIVSDDSGVTVQIPTERPAAINYTLRAVLVNEGGKAYTKQDGSYYTAESSRVAPATSGSGSGTGTGTGTGGGTGTGTGTGSGTGETIPNGNGSQSSPYNASGVNAAFANLAQSEYSSEQVYVKGYVVAQNDYSGNPTPFKGKEGDWRIYIADSANGTNTFFVNYAAGASDKTINVGDIVTVYGYVENYQGIQMYKKGTTKPQIIDVVSGGTTSGGSTGGGTGTGGSVSGDTITIDMATYATQNGWTVSTQNNVVPYASVECACATITVTATQNPKSDGVLSGAWYTNWRLYGSESATLTFTAKSGYTLTTVTVTYESTSSGVLTNNGTNVTSGTAVTVNGTSLSLSITTGQARITQIVIGYTQG